MASIRKSTTNTLISTLTALKTDNCLMDCASLLQADLALLRFLESRCGLMYVRYAPIIRAIGTTFLLYAASKRMREAAKVQLSS